jgi:hypothetical protein
MHELVRQHAIELLGLLERASKGTWIRPSYDAAVHAGMRVMS